MRILLVGSGGREHAMAWKISRSPLLDRLIWTPGNGGRVPKGETAAVSAGDVQGILALAKEQRIDLVVVGPEAPLADGLADSLASKGIRCFGPSAAAARLESSKAFTKEFCIRHGIDTAAYSAYTTDKLFENLNTENAADPATKEVLRYRRSLMDGYGTLAKLPLSTRTAETICTTITGVTMRVRKVPGTKLANATTAMKEATI